MKIEVDESARASRIDAAVKECLDKIKANAAQGNRTTELYVLLDIASDVRQRLEDEVDDITFLVVRHAPNPYTGRMDHFSSRTEGDHKYYKVTV